MDIEFIIGDSETYARITLQYHSIEIAMNIYGARKLNSLRITDGQLELQTWYPDTDYSTCIVIAEDLVEFWDARMFIKLPRSFLVDSEIIRLRDTLAEYIIAHPGTLDTL